ncbi:MAG: radical SAM protein [Candidatus Aenigmatarchaeota archaeon]
MSRRLRILFVDTPYTNIIRGSCPPGEPTFVEANHPIGLLYVGTYVKKKLGDVDVRILGFKPSESEEGYYKKTKHMIYDFKPDIVGINAYTFTLYDAYQIAKIVKSKSPKTKVVFGGPNTSIYPSEMVNQPFVDAICMGDGEETFLEFVEKFETQDMYYVRGMWCKSDGDILKNPARSVISNLDTIPFPDRKLLVDPSIYIGSHVSSGYRKAEMISSRGCPYSCAYCQSRGKVYRFRSAKNVVDEMEYLLNDGYNFLQFWDDTFNIQVSRVKEICREIIRRNLQSKMKYRIRIVGNLVDEEMMELLKESGCDMIYIGVESASDQFLRYVDRKISIEHCVRAIDLARKFRIEVMGYFMIGFPGETREDMEKTLQLMIKLPLSFMETSILTPMPSTPLYVKAIEEGKMDDWYRRYTISPWKNAWYKYYTELSPKEIYKIQKRIYFRFYFRPSYVLRLAVKSRNLNSFAARLKAAIKLFIWIIFGSYSDSDRAKKNSVFRRLFGIF